MFGRDENQEEERPNFIKIMADIDAKLAANREQKERERAEKEHVRDRAVQILIQAGIPIEVIRRLQAGVI